MSDASQVPDSLPVGAFEIALSIEIYRVVTPILIRKGVLPEGVSAIDPVSDGLSRLCMKAACEIAQWAFDQEDWSKDASL